MALQLNDEQAQIMVRGLAALCNSQPYYHGDDTDPDAALGCDHCDAEEQWGSDDDPDDEPQPRFFHGAQCIVGQSAALLQELGFAPTFVEFGGCARFEIPPVPPDEAATH